MPADAVAGEVPPLDFGGPSERPYTPYGHEWLERPVYERFAAIARARPETTAVYDHYGRADYGELLWRSAAIAGQVAAAVPPGEPVAIALTVDRRYPAAMLGALAAGRPYVPLDVSFPAERLRRILRHSGARAVVSDREGADALAGVIPSGTALLVPAERPGGDALRRGAGGPDSVAYILYTSGSSGAPKGVYQDQRGLSHDVLQYTDSVRLGTDDCCSLLYSPSVNGAIRDIFGALLNGAALCMCDLRRDGLAAALRQLKQARISVLHAMPPILRSLVRAGGGEPFPSSVRLAYVAGDRLFPSDVRLLRSALPRRCLLYTGIGSTECATLYRQWFVPHDWPLDGPLLPVGRAVPERELGIVDSDDRPVPVGEVGELVVTSRYVARGYWREPALTQASFGTVPGEPQARRFRTGDRGRLREDGLLEFIGRADRQVKVRGYRVEPAEIEAALREREGVQEAALVVDEDGDVPRIAAYLEGPAPADAAGISAAMRESLPAHLCPHEIVVLERLPRLPNFKLDGRALRALDERRRNAARTSVAAVAPSDALVRRVAAVWEQVIGRPALPGRRFDEQGGDSLKALELEVALEGAFGRVPPALVEPSSSVEGIAERLRSAGGGPSFGTGHPIPLFVIPGAPGAGIRQRRLVEALAPAIRAYLLDYPRLKEELARLSDFADLARRCADRVAELAGSARPVALLGTSYGGRVAFDCARILRQRGVPVIWLGIGDIGRDARAAERLLVEAAAGVMGQATPVRRGLAALWERTCYYTARARLGWALRVLYRAAERLGGDDEPRRLALIMLLAIRRAAVAGWRAEPYAGEAVLFLTDGTAADLQRRKLPVGWDECCRTLRRLRLPGDHASYLGQGVDGFARLVRDEFIRLERLADGPDVHDRRDCPP